MSSTEKDSIKHIVTRKIIVEFNAIRSLIRNIHVVRTHASVKRQSNLCEGFCLEDAMNQIISLCFISLLWSTSLKTGEIERAVRTRAAISSLLVTFSCRLVQPLYKRKDILN